TVLDPGRLGYRVRLLGEVIAAQRRLELRGAGEFEHGRVRAVRLASGRQPPGRGGRHSVELLGQGDLCLPRHTDPDTRRLLRMTIVSWSPGPVNASTLPASAVSTVQAKVSLAGGCGVRLGTDTEIVISSRPSAKLHSRALPGMAWLSSMAHASSTAIRRSSISSRVKSSRAARPAVAVRSTDRYAPAAGSVMVTTSLGAAPLVAAADSPVSCVTRLRAFRGSGS